MNHIISDLFTNFPTFDAFLITRLHYSSIDFCDFFHLFLPLKVSTGQLLITQKKTNSFQIFILVDDRYKLYLQNNLPNTTNNTTFTLYEHSLKELIEHNSLTKIAVDPFAFSVFDYNGLTTTLNANKPLYAQEKKSNNQTLSIELVNFYPLLTKHLKRSKSATTIQPPPHEHNIEHHTQNHTNNTQKQRKHQNNTFTTKLLQRHTKQLITEDRSTYLNNATNVITTNKTNTLSSTKKLSQLIAKLDTEIKHANTLLLITNPIEVAWLFNLFGNFYPYSRSPHVYCLINCKTRDYIFFNEEFLKNSQFLDKNLNLINTFSAYTFNTNIYSHLNIEKTQLYTILAFENSTFHLTSSFLTTFGFDIAVSFNKWDHQYLQQTDSNINPNCVQKHITTNNSNTTIYAEIMYIENYLQEIRCVKQLSEIDGFKKALQIDACFWNQLLAQIYKLETITEKKIFQEIKKLRNYQLNFEPIIAINEHSSMIHYNSKDNKECSEYFNIVLIDTGALYPTGASDITRTLLIPNKNSYANNKSQKIYTSTCATHTFTIEFAIEKIIYQYIYTIVLKAHISAVITSFNEMSLFSHIDATVRGVINEFGFDYAHSTGHGIGREVHENGASISRYNTNIIKENIVLTIEPGIYLHQYQFKNHKRKDNKNFADYLYDKLLTTYKNIKDYNVTKIFELIDNALNKNFSFGIRLENVFYIKNLNQSPQQYQLIPLSFIPFDNNLIDYFMLNIDEKNWLNSYNEIIQQSITK